MPVPVTLENFASAAIPHAEWNHRAHLTIAYLLLREFPLDQATDRMRLGVQRYNAAHSIAQTLAGGYHHTLTIAWMRVLHATMTVYGHAEGAEAFFEQHPHLLSRALLRIFYSRERIMSWEARTSFVEPDLAALPSIPRGLSPMSTPLAPLRQHLMYSDLAPWWPLISPPSDYAEEAEQIYTRLLTEATTPPPRTVLELGSGGGNNALYMKRRFEMTLVDLSPQMLNVSRAVNSELEHIAGDMRTLRLGRTFDAVFIHDAVMYMTTEDDLRLALQTAAAHCRTGGVLLVTPDSTRETFTPSTDHGGADSPAPPHPPPHAPPHRSLRYLSWTSDPNPDDTTYDVTLVYVLREGSQPPVVHHETQQFGFFPRATWLSLLAAAGFDPRLVQVADGRDVFIGVRRA